MEGKGNRLPKHCERGPSSSLMGSHVTTYLNSSNFTGFKNYLNGSNFTNVKKCAYVTKLNSCVISTSSEESKCKDSIIHRKWTTHIALHHIKARVHINILLIFFCSICLKFLTNPSSPINSNNNTSSLA